MAVCKLFQQTRFHFRKKPSAGHFAGNSVNKDNSLSFSQTSSFIEPDGISWKEQQQLQKALNISLRTSPQKKFIDKKLKVRTRSNKSRLSQTIINRKMNLYQPTKIIPLLSHDNISNVKKNIFFAEDFINFLCCRQDIKKEKTNSWQDFTNFWNFDQVKTESGDASCLRLSQTAHSSMVYNESPPKSEESSNMFLENDSDCMSESSLEPTDVSAYFVQVI